MKRFIAILAMLAVVLFAAPSAAAVTTPVVTYDGSSAMKYTDTAGNPISGNGDFGTAFSNMIPGVENSQQIILNNSSKESAKIYMALSVLQTLKNAGLDGAGYTVELKTTTQTLYSSVNGQASGTAVGGDGSTKELGDINEALVSSDGTGLLVCTLEPGKQETVTLTIQPDATMSNPYQAARGTLEFRFFGERVGPTGITTVYVPGQTLVKVVKTGDSSPIYIVAAVLVVGVVILLATGKSGRKAKKQR